MKNINVPDGIRDLVDTLILISFLNESIAKYLIKNRDNIGPKAERYFKKRIADIVKIYDEISVLM